MCSCTCGCVDAAEVQIIAGLSSNISSGSTFTCMGSGSPVPLSINLGRGRNLCELGMSCLLPVMDACAHRTRRRIAQ